MDWAWVYGTLIRNAGWTFAQCDEQPAADVFTFLEHLADHPPDYVILAAVHLKPKGPGKLTDTEAAIASELFGPAQPMPAHIREQIEWAEAFNRKHPQTR